jgi:hypothetical protein
MYTIPSSLEPGTDTGYMVHPPGGMLEVGKGSQHAPAQDRFLIVQARCARFLKSNSLRNDIAYDAGIHVSMQTVRRRPCTRIPLTRRHRQAHIHGGPCNTGDTFCSLMSPRSAMTSQVGVLESGEDEVNRFRLQVLVSMTATGWVSYDMERHQLGWTNRPCYAK